MVVQLFWVKGSIDIYTYMCDVEYTLKGVQVYGITGRVAGGRAR